MSSSTSKTKVAVLGMGMAGAYAAKAASDKGCFVHVYQYGKSQFPLGAFWQHWVPPDIAEKVAGPTSWAILIISIIVGLIYGITFQNEEMIINNTAWQNPSDSILTDTCMWSISILMVGTIASIVYSMFGSRK